MAENAARGIIEIDLDKPRRLWFNFRAMKELKEKHGIRASNLDQMLSDEGDVNYDNIAILLAYGLRHEDPSITPEWVTDNVGVVELVRYMGAIQAAFGATPAGAAAPPEAVGAKK